MLALFLCLQYFDAVCVSCLVVRVSDAANFCPPLRSVSFSFFFRIMGLIYRKDSFRQAAESVVVDELHARTE